MHLYLGTKIKGFVGCNRRNEMVSSSGYWGSRDFGIWVIDNMCKNSGFEVIFFVSSMRCLDGRERERDERVLGAVDSIDEGV